MKKELSSRWIPMDEVVNMACIDDADDVQANRQRYNNWGIRGFKKLRWNLLKETKAVLLPVNEATGTVAYPKDYLKWLTVARIDECGELVDLPLVQRTETTDTVSTDCSCKTCTDHSLCGKATYERTEEEVIIDGNPYPKITVLFYDTQSGYYKREITEPVQDFSGGIAVPGPQPLITKTTVEDLCKLETLPCGCVARSETNYQRLRSCCCCNALQFFAHTTGQRSCPDEWFTEDEENGLFHVSEGVSKIWLKYKVALPCVDGKIYVPEVAAEYLVAFILHKQDRRHRRTTPQVKIDDSYLTLKRERSELRKNVFPLHLKTLENSLNQIPR